MDEEEVCTKLNFCYYGEEPIPRSDTDAGRGRHVPHHTSSGRGEGENRENLLKVVQLTDIHIDHEYTVVRIQYSMKSSWHDISVDFRFSSFRYM